MEYTIFTNGLKLIYKYREGDITSFCIGFEAGALADDENKLGIAHAVEHMVFKGTINRDELCINKECDEVFGFHNAMTNYPYAIYYGTTLREDFQKGFDIYTDILLNPIFPKEGFEEEISVILQELAEWRGEPEQFCEDELLSNSFKSRRIKNLIIGTEECIKTFTIEDVKQFYKKFYVPQNCVISIASSLSFEEVYEIVCKNYNSWNGSLNKREYNLYERNIPGTFCKGKESYTSARIQYIFDIGNLDENELKTLRLFNSIFGEGTSSMLYDEIRTKNGLAYDVTSIIKNEKGIKLLVIALGTSSDNVKKCMELIDEKINFVKNNNEYFSRELIAAKVKNIRLKNQLKIERSIELCKSLTTHEIMYGSYRELFEEEAGLENVTEKELNRVINKVLVNPSVQVLKF